MRRIQIALSTIILGALPMTSTGQEQTKEIRFGIIGTDTSHVIAFSKVLNKPGEKGHIPGARVTHAFKGGSPDVKSSYERVDKYAEQLQQEFGVQLVDSIDELVKNVDAVMLESVDGRPHLDQARPVFAAKKPLFIDKPLAGSLVDALEIAKLAKETSTPCWSSSSLRFFAGVTDLRSSPTVGDIMGVDAYSPCALEEHHPDFYWYGVHGVEILYTLMGPGCESVSRTHTQDYDLAVGTWSGGRIGTFRGLRAGKQDYGAMVFGSKGIRQSAPVSGDLYRPLVQQIVEFARTGNAPVSMDETVEIMAFMEAADESKRQGGKPVKLDEVIQKASAKK